ncbi:MAG: YggS family pyridoxal phosphate-dependent enzyme [Oscillospiraceae bacterium]|nr:YggS family pyridoxal phosphate-dependent enzyme [Oscillospiraceae bacterium]
MDHIKKNLKEIQTKIDEAVSARDPAYGGPSEKVRLLAVTKSVEPEKINSAIEAGVDLIGENRAGELLEKYDKINKSGVEIHFIGNLQTNKVKYIIDKVSLIHSVNSIRLAEEINKRAAQHNIKMDILAEVNIGGESTKTGIAPGEVLEFANSLRDFGNLRLSGLMAIAPPRKKQSKTELLKLFGEMREIFVDISSKKMDNIDMRILSMGMSEDFEEAISRGANIVRIGRAIFGENF